MLGVARTLLFKFLPSPNPCCTNTKDFFGSDSSSDSSPEPALRTFRNEESAYTRTRAVVVAEEKTLVESLAKLKHENDELVRFSHMSSAANAIAVLTGLQPLNPALLALEKSARENGDIADLLSDLQQLEPGVDGHEADYKKEETNAPRLIKESRSAGSLNISPLTLNPSDSSASLFSQPQNHPPDGYHTDDLARSLSFHADSRASSPADEINAPEISMTTLPFPH